MHQRLNAIPRWLGFTGKLGADQIVQRSTWGGVPDSEMSMAAVHRINCQPLNASTTTYVNRLDPASDSAQTNCEWKDAPGKFGEVTYGD